MKKLRYSLFTVIFIFVISTNVFAWGSGTHTYFADQLGNKYGYLNAQEMYGAVLPDVFNLMYDNPFLQAYLTERTHEDFMQVVNKAYWPNLKAAAFGFASHNDVWGADFTAHREGFTTPGDGWVEAHAWNLSTQPGFIGPITILLSETDIPAPLIAQSLAHDFIETAVDILIRFNEDPRIGYRIMLSAELRAPGVPLLLVSSYAKGLRETFGLSFFQSSALIFQAEREFRDLMKNYGMIFTQNEETIKQLLSELGAQLVNAQLYSLAAQLGIGLPDNFAVTPVQIKGLLEYTIDYVENSDYAEEISTTLTYLEGAMEDYGIETGSSLFVFKEGAEDGLNDFEQPAEYSLEQNYPNPFNPATTIRFSLLETGHVNIAVFNSLGQKVATLVDDVFAKGSHSIEWDAGNLPSGTYYYSIRTKNFMATKRMNLIK